MAWMSQSSQTVTDAPQEQAAGEPPAWEQRLRRFGYAPRRGAGLRERLVPPHPEPGAKLWQYFGLSPAAAGRLARWSAWGGPLLVALLAGVLRFVNLGSPDAVIFDETYYAKDAWSLLEHGYETEWPDNANDRIVAGETPEAEGAAYVVHPPGGKWVIALGEWLFGLTPFGWRFMVAVLGTLSVLMLCRIGRRLLRSTVLGCLAGLLMAVDGLHFVMSRTALLDLVLMFWLLAAFGCLLIDRDAARARLAAALPVGRDGLLRPDVAVGERLGLGLRPWRIAAGVCLGLAAATKWNALYVLAAFGILTVLWDAAARRTAGAPRAYPAMLRRDAVPAFVSMVPVALGAYLASWSGWFATSGGYYRDWAEEAGADSSFSWLPGPLRSLWHYTSEVYSFHVELTSEHNYESNPWTWLATTRPVTYFYSSREPGEGGCEHASGCAREVLALGTPLLWWSACFALVYAGYRWLFRRDWRAGAVLCAVAAGYLPWFLYQERTIFYFYAVILVPFLCLAVAMMIGAILGPPGCSERRRVAGIVGAGVLVLLIAWNFIYFYPIYTGMEIPLDGWRARMWLGTWV
ncbi:phospholipid carrier-dependent glycosyltransferase [Streptomyces sp. MP131-18]|uniref:dolichyl-phosphate-mannose--protein mannosyltransferase n=1 Tax=Streptomyces sp. MP131-18 TaxID=1857892 RepID=UPI00097C5008|nr:phospholipid carrier-dependent glycosyltransferase [Streptomyces sp. MP131-18]ONK13741.1 putative dolichyl-phosphate-mannose--protein mannosyltransferase [Streptomyces sp. MP131-18]